MKSVARTTPVEPTAKFVSLLYAYNNGKSFQKASAITKFILKLLFAFKWSL